MASLCFWIVSNWYAILATYHCISLKRVVEGTVYQCTNVPIGDRCRGNVGYSYGWCNDPENYGSHPGTVNGPYGADCKSWVWNEDSCPPERCNDIDQRNWGWCADPGVERAMIGASCGPKTGSCNNWIWDAKRCSDSCTRSGTSTEEEQVKKVQKQCLCSRKIGKSSEVEQLERSAWTDKTVQIFSTDYQGNKMFLCRSGTSAVFRPGTNSKCSSVFQLKSGNGNGIIITDGDYRLTVSNDDRVIFEKQGQERDRERDITEFTLSGDQTDLFIDINTPEGRRRLDNVKGIPKFILGDSMSHVIGITIVSGSVSGSGSTH